MERLTTTSDKGAVAFTFDLEVEATPQEMIKILRLAEKLKYYEDLEEQGRLIKLPIEYKNGDYRECVHTRTQCHYMEYKCSECPLTGLFCDEFYLAIDKCYEDAYASGCLAGIELGKSEAEAKLAEMKKNESEERK